MKKLILILSIIVFLSCIYTYGSWTLSENGIPIDNDTGELAFDAEAKLTEFKEKMIIVENSYKPSLPKAPIFSDYVGVEGDDVNIWNKILGFFDWIGSIFKFIGDFVSYLVANMVYYWNVVKTLLEVLGVLNI